MFSLAWSHHFISKEKCLLLYNASFSKSPSQKIHHFLDSMNKSECFHKFQVRKINIVRLANALGLPGSLCCHERTKANCTEGALTYLTCFLSLLLENKTVDLSPPTRSFSCSGKSFAPGGKTHLLPLSFYSSSLYHLRPPSGPLPSGAQLEAMRGFCWLFICNTCPIQPQFRLLICSLVQVLARHLTSSTHTFIGQYIFSNLRRHLCRNVSSFASSLFVILQVCIHKVALL